MRVCVRRSTHTSMRPQTPTSPESERNACVALRTVHSCMSLVHVTPPHCAAPSCTHLPWAPARENLSRTPPLVYQKKKIQARNGNDSYLLTRLYVRSSVFLFLFLFLLIAILLLSSCVHCTHNSIVSCNLFRVYLPPSQRGIYSEFWSMCTPLCGCMHQCTFK